MSTSQRQPSVALVTGASRGIGRATALALARAGWHVALVARSGEDLEAVTGQIRDSGGRAAWYATDIKDCKAVGETVAEICQELGPPVGLVNNAASLGPVGPVLSADPLTWERTVHTNLMGAYYCIYAVLGRMAEEGRGLVLNIVSGMGLRVFPRFSAYSVSKAGLIHLTRILAEEVRADGITVNALDPGLVQTDMHEQLRKMGPDVVGREMFQNLDRLREEKLFKPPEHIGEWVATFFSEKAWEVTGEVGTLSDYEARYGIRVPSVSGVQPPHGRRRDGYKEE